MIEAKHTPGPWSAKQIPIQSQGGSNTCWEIGPFHACIYDDGRQRERGFSGEEIEANARLIAAAPELFAALQDAWEFIEGFVDGAPDASANSKKANLLEENISRALAKAEGRAA